MDENPATPETLGEDSLQRLLDEGGDYAIFLLAAGAGGGRQPGLCRLHGRLPAAARLRGPGRLRRPSACEAALRLAPEVILLDLGLPGMSGFDVAARVCEADLAQPLIVAMTGYGQPEDRDKTREAGFGHHLVKPVDLARIEEILAGR